MNTIQYTMEYLHVFVGRRGGVGKMIKDATEALGWYKNTKGLEYHIKNLGLTTPAFILSLFCSQCHQSIWNTLLLSFINVCLFLLDSKQHEGRACI